MKILQHKFVEFIPKEKEEGIIYISMEYGTAVHKCVCGCGSLVVTPFSPTDWEITFNGETISLYPSIGNWNFKCQSHYFIINNEIKFARKWSKREIRLGRLFDKEYKEKYFKKT